MFRLFAIANLLAISMAYKITPVVQNGRIQANVSTAPFVQIHNGLYYIETKLLKNWFDAYETCRLIGAELISFETKDEWNAILEYIKGIDNKQRSYWTSGTDFAKQGEHVWFSNGQSISDDIWQQGEPNGINNEERCDAFTRWVQDNIPNGLNDDICDKKYYYICETAKPTSIGFIVW